jgi:hypothetical protein
MKEKSKIVYDLHTYKEWMDLTKTVSLLGHLIIMRRAMAVNTLAVRWAGS